jgi:hypothetical protein
LLAHIPDQLDQLPQACEAVEDWDHTMRAAHANGVLGLLSWALNQSGWQLPAQVAEWTHTRVRASAMQQLQARASLRKVLAELDRAKIRCAPFTGPFLADQYYPQGVVRSAVDLDILIDPRHRGEAEEALRSIGYLVEDPGPVASYERFRHEIKASKADATAVELHQHVNSSFGVPVPTGPFLDRSTCVSNPQLGRVRDLALADALLLVTLHASASLFVAAKWLMDVKLLALAASPTQVKDALVRAEEHHVLSAFIFGLHYVQKVNVRTPALPSRAAWRVRHQVAAALRPAVLSSLAQGRPSPMPLVHLVLSDSLLSWPRLAGFRLWDHLRR